MDLMDTTLYEIIGYSGGGDLKEGVIAYVAGEILTAINHLHQCNLIHRDIKDPNILVRTIKWW